WGAFKSRTRPAIGNHDSHDTSCSVDGNGYFDYFNGVGSGTCDYTCHAGRRGEGWYSYDVGDWHFIALNSECNGTSYDFCDHTDPNGIRHFIVGTGGNGNYDVTETKPGQEFAVATLGIMKLTLNPTNYSWQFVNTSNTVLDSGSDSCRSTQLTDTDGDGWPDSAEATIGTNPNMKCVTNAWPSDSNNDRYADAFDLSKITNWYARPVPPSPA